MIETTMSILTSIFCGVLAGTIVMKIAEIRINKILDKQIKHFEKEHEYFKRVYSKNESGTTQYEFGKKRGEY